MWLDFPIRLTAGDRWVQGEQNEVLQRKSCQGSPRCARLPAGQVQDERRAVANTPAWAFCTKPRGGGGDGQRGGRGSERRAGEGMVGQPCVPGAVLGLSDPHGGARGPGILPELPSTLTAIERFRGRDGKHLPARTPWAGPFGHSGVVGGVDEYGKDRDQGSVVALMAAVSQGLALLGSGGLVSPPQGPLCPQCAHTALLAQAGHFSNQGWEEQPLVSKRPGPGLFAGSRARAAPRLEIRPVASGFLGTPANPPHGDKSGLPPAIMEFRKPEKNSILKCKGRGKNKGRGSQEPRESFCVFLKKQMWVFQATTWNISKEVVNA